MKISSVLHFRKILVESCASVPRRGEPGMALIKAFQSPFVRAAPGDGGADQEVACAKKSNGREVV